ncbi:MAG: hypothetical protein U0797_15560 [Gemmataceae bacterium]
MEGRDYVVLDDVKRLARPVLWLAPPVGAAAGPRRPTPPGRLVPRRSSARRRYRGDCPHPRPVPIAPIRSFMGARSPG